MVETKLHMFAMQNGYVELAKKIENFDISQLFAELDDTIQIDIMNLSNEEWTFMRSKKCVYTAICRELIRRYTH